MKTSELETLRNQLLKLKSQTLNGWTKFRDQTRQPRPFEGLGDEAEMASNELSKVMSFELHERERRLITKIDHALQKIYDHTYGECEICAAEISVQRLLARPFASLCIQCKEEQETSGSAQIGR